MKDYTILLIEDEDHIAKGIQFNLEQQGYTVHVANDGIQGLEMWENLRPTLIVLDLMLPFIDGYSVLKKIRSIDEYIPVLILSAKDRPIDRVKALKDGAFDYLTKPFDLDEFLIRIEGLIKRYELLLKSSDATESNLNESYTFGSNTIFFNTAKAATSSGEQDLTAQELKLLQFFIRKQGKVVSRQQLLENVWGYSKDIESRTIDNFIVRMRRYFEPDPKKPQHFLSKRGQGYIFLE